MIKIKKVLSLSVEMMDRVRGMSVITTGDVRSQLFNMCNDFYSGSVNICQIRAKGEYVRSLLKEMSRNNLADIENNFVFFGIGHAEQIIGCPEICTFVWVPFSCSIYIFSGEPFEFVVKPRVFGKKYVAEYEVEKINYEKGTGYNDMTKKSYNIVQENSVRRTFEVSRWRMEAVSDTLFSVINWRNFGTREQESVTHEPMYYLRNSPENLKHATKISDSDKEHMVVDHGRCSDF